MKWGIDKYFGGLELTKMDGDIISQIPCSS